MFTGIIEGTGKLLGRRTVGGGMAFDIDAGFEITDPEEGESIAVNGVCLTAYNIKGSRFSADVSPETLSRTQLGVLRTGDGVNLERALRLSDRLGGHLVSGHVDCVGSVISRKDVGNYTLFSFLLSQDHERYIIEKGSITIDGISLTVNSCGAGKFSVSIIPHTLKTTTLGALKAGSKVNIEVDLIGKYVEKLLSPKEKDSSSDGMSAGFLAQHGFM